MPTTSPLPIPRSSQRVREPLHVAVQVGVGDLALLALLAAPVERHLVALAGLDVAIQAVVGDVQLAVLEPLVERGVRLVQRPLGLLVPVEELLGLPGPKALQVALGLLVERPVLDQRLLAKLLGGRKPLHLEQRRELALEAAPSRASGSFQLSPRSQSTLELPRCIPARRSGVSSPARRGYLPAMAQTRRRRRKHRGTQGGSIDRRGRGEPPAQPPGGPRPRQASRWAPSATGRRPGAARSTRGLFGAGIFLVLLVAPLPAARWSASLGPGPVHAPDLHPAGPLHRPLHLQPPPGGEAARARAQRAARRVGRCSGAAATLTEPWTFAPSPSARLPRTATSPGATAPTAG